MARKRTAEAWARLKPDYRNRLIRKGITKQAYIDGANLQVARGQTTEAKRTQAKALKPSIPGASTVRAWRARALRRGITREDWDAAIRDAGLTRFDTVRAAVLAVEARHRAWVQAGQPRKFKLEPRAPDAKAPPKFQAPPIIVPPKEYVYDPDDNEYYPPEWIDEHAEQFDTEDLLYDYYEPDPEVEWGQSWGYYH